MYYFTVFYFYVCSVRCWDLGSVGLDTAIVSHVTVVRNKAFLSVPRLSGNQSFTLIEAPWPEKAVRLGKGVAAFPRNTEQTLDDCNNVQSAVSTDDDSRGRLYVLDAGYDECEPKVVIYDIRTNKKISDTTLSSIPPTRLHSIIVDPASPHGTRAYIGDAGDGFLIVYNANNRHWWRVYLAPPPGVTINYVPTYDMVVSASKVEPKLYLTSEQTDQLLSLSLVELRKVESPPPVYCDSTKHNATELSINIEGSKLGRSVGLAVDARNGVYYYLPHGYACVRWDSRQPIRAESHDIVLQSADQLSDVKQLFSDGQNQIWSLIGRSRNGSYCFLLRKPNSIAY